MAQDLMTTAEAARALGVGTTTIKRWSDEGRLPCAKTAGKHRRFERITVERLRQQQQIGDALDQLGQESDAFERWSDLLLEEVEPQRLQALLLDERGRLGAWWRVAEEVGQVLERLGQLWASGAITVAQEHSASNGLVRAIASCAASIPVGLAARRCLLTAVEGELHTIALHLVELCLREAGWSTSWLGGYLPTEEIEGALAKDAPDLVAVSASAWSGDGSKLAQHHDRIADVCRARGAALVVGGSGAWPEPPSYGHRLRSFAELRALLVGFDTTV